MKRLFSAVAAIILASSLCGQRRLKIVEVEEIGFVAKTEFNSSTKNSFIYKGVEVTITPVSPQDLDRLFEKAESLDGRSTYTYFEKSRESFFLKKKKKFRFKSDAEFLIEGLDWMNEEEIITDEMYSDLYADIAASDDSDTRNQIVTNFSVSKKNPYSLSNKYLTTFKIEYANSTNEPVEMNSPIQVLTKSQVLNSLNPDEILSLYTSQNISAASKFENLMRFDNHFLKSIPANSRIVTYFATLPIDNSSQMLEIVIPSVARLKWDVQNTRNDINKTYKFYEINITLRDNQAYMTSGDNYIIVLNKSKDLFIDNDKLYVGTDALNNPIQLFVYSLYNDRLYYSKITDINPKDYLDLDKKKRKTVKIDMTTIKELKKKVRS